MSLHTRSEEIRPLTPAAMDELMHWSRSRDDEAAQRAHAERRAQLNRAAMSRLLPPNPLGPAPEHTYRANGEDDLTRRVDELVIREKMALLRLKQRWLESRPDAWADRLPPGYEARKAVLKEVKQDYAAWLHRSHQEDRAYESILARLEPAETFGAPKKAPVEKPQWAPYVDERGWWHPRRDPRTTEHGGPPRPKAPEPAEPSDTTTQE